MCIRIEITNQELFERKVENVDVSTLKPVGKSAFDGGIYIYARNGSVIPFYGLITEHDFEKEYGFVLKCD